MESPRVVVIGAGMSGICVAHKLLEAGIGSVKVLEKRHDVGGTWRDNTYPGLSCDVASRAYCYSFAPNAEWTSTYPPGEEVHAYFRRVAEQSGVIARTSFGEEVTEARWHEDRWLVETASVEVHEAEILVSACGVLHHPVTPEIPGLESFAGPAFHSSRWDHSAPIDGRRVGLIGTGSSGVQITKALAPRAGKLSVFIRTPQWVFPAPNLRFSALNRWLHRRFPKLSRLSYRGWQKLYEYSFVRPTMRPGIERTIMQGLCRAHLRAVRDPELRRRLTPSDQPMCRRLIGNWGYYQALQRNSVEPVFDAITEIVPEGVGTADGRLHELDALVLATGFDTQAYLRPVELVGPGGARLSEAWSHKPYAYRTVAVPGFPNFLMLMGPHSPVGNVSLVAIAETQADYVVRWAELIRRGEIGAAAPRADVTSAYNESMSEAMPQTVWATGCKSWYLDADGVPSLWPWTPARHREMLAEPKLEELEPAGSRATARI